MYACTGILVFCLYEMYEIWPLPGSTTNPTVEYSHQTSFNQRHQSDEEKPSRLPAHHDHHTRETPTIQQQQQRRLVHRRKLALAVLTAGGCQCSKDALMKKKRSQIEIRRRSIDRLDNNHRKNDRKSLCDRIPHCLQNAHACTQHGSKHIHVAGCTQQQQRPPAKAAQQQQPTHVSQPHGLNILLHTARTYVHINTPTSHEEKHGRRTA